MIAWALVLLLAVVAVAALVMWWSCHQTINYLLGAFVRLYGREGLDAIQADVREWAESSAVREVQP